MEAESASEREGVIEVRAATIIGAGRAGGSLAAALGSTGRWSVEVVGRGFDEVGGDLVVIATPDAAVTSVADALEADAGRVVTHMSGSLGPAPVVRHPRWAVLHPLVSMPSVDASRLAGAWFGIAGDPIAAEVVEDLDGHAVPVGEGRWPEYHAAAVIASNHLVGLLGQVERVASAAGVPLDAYLDLARGAIGNVGVLGPAAALTGPVRRGDWATVERHLAALPDDERAAYQAGVDLCRRLLPNPRR